MGNLDTATKIWTFVVAGITLVLGIAAAAWEVRGVFARFEHLEAENAILRDRIEYVNDRSERLIRNHEEEHHGN